MKKILAGLVVVIMALYFAINKQESNTLVIYSALEQYRNDDLKAHLAEKFPDLNVQIMYMPVSYTHLTLPTKA